MDTGSSKGGLGMSGGMKGVITEAFVSLCMKKNIDKITVKDIVEVCGISRQTFYYHFQDMLDVVEWAVDQAVQEALANSLKEDTLEAALEVFLKMAVEKHEVILRLMQSQRREHLEKLFTGCIEQYLKGLLQVKAVARAISAEDLDVAGRFYSCGVVGVLLDYCERKDLNVKKLASQLAKLLTNI